MKGADHPLDRPQDPRVADEHIRLLLGVARDVEEIGRLERALAFVHLGLPVEMQLPVAPLHCAQFVLDMEEKALAQGFLFAEEKRHLIDAIDRPVLGNAGAARACQRGEEVGDVHDLVAHPTCGDLARPAHDARHAQAAFHGRVIGAAPGAGRAAVRGAELGAVVAREDEEGVF
ncbi:hypothetical protein D3C72_1891130 [compost metagenome]